MTDIKIPFMPGDAGQNLSVEIMDVETFFELPPWITQRDILKRSKKSSVRSNLSTLRPPHLIVAIGELTADDEDENGNEYKKGTRFIIDSNTRKLFWMERNTPENVPSHVIAHVYKSDTLIGLRNVYYAYDNPDATEQAAEVMTGIYALFEFKPESNKIVGGSIVSAQNYASMWTPDAPLYGTNKGIWGIDPDESETKTQAKRWAMAEQFKFWNNEWRYLDKFKIGRKGSVIDQPLLMALLIAARAYMGNTKFDDLVYKLNSKDYNPSKSTPISKIGEAACAQTSEVYTKGTASFQQYLNAFNFYLYWIDRHMSDPTQENCAAPKGGYHGKGAAFIEKRINSGSTAKIEQVLNTNL